MTSVIGEFIEVGRGVISTSGKNLVYRLQNGFTATDLFQNSLGGGRPHEGLRRLIVHPDVFRNGCDELGDALEDAPANSLRGEFPEPPLDEIHPGRAGRGEVQVEPRVLGQPALYVRMRVRAVVVHDQVQVAIGRSRAIELSEERPEHHPSGLRVPGQRVHEAQDHPGLLFSRSFSALARRRQHFVMSPSYLRVGHPTRIQFRRTGMPIFY